jgi:uncharacterized integral membrane protein (TIGR00697 family)
MDKRLRYYDVIVAVFVVVLVVSNISATKLIAFGPIIADGGAVLFPLAYILGDVLTEVYGYKYTRRAIWIAFGVLLMSVAAFTIVRYLPAAADYTDQAAFESVLGFFPRIVLASLAAFLVGSFVNSYILAKLKVRMAGKQLWVRLIGSTLVGELLDTIVFGLVAFAGVLSAPDMVAFVLVGWLFKTVVEIALLPITYRVVNALKTREHMDEYDTATDFNPLKLRV